MFKHSGNCDGFHRPVTVTNIHPGTQARSVSSMSRTTTADGSNLEASSDPHHSQYLFHPHPVLGLPGLFPCGSPRTPFFSQKTRNYKTIHELVLWLSTIQRLCSLQTRTWPATSSDLTPGFLSDVISHLCPLWSSCPANPRHLGRL